MTYYTVLILTVFETVAVLLALVLMLSLMHRGGHERLLNKVVMGGLFSVAILFSMSDPIVLSDQVCLFDVRNLLVGTASALLGPFVGVIALVTAAAFRVFIGGEGVVPDLVAIAVVFSMGFFWYISVREWPIATIKKSIILGVVLSFQVFAIFLAPTVHWEHLFTILAPHMVVSSIVGSIIINHFLSGELSFLSEVEASKIEANTDHLTGLLNRRGLALIYPDFLENRDINQGQAVLYFDIDRFKLTNDTYGHAVGDEVLCHVVDQVAANLRQKDTFVRLGGDEFVVILPDIDAAGAKAIGERCRQVVAECGYTLDCAVLPLSISVGAVWAQKPTRVQTLISYADKALYQAKEKGRNTVVFASKMRGSMAVAA